MSYRITQTLTPGQTVVLQLKSSLSVKAAEFWNGSPYDIDYLGPGSLSELLIPAGIGNRFFVEQSDPSIKQTTHSNPGTITITANDNTNAGGSGVINILIYEWGDVVPDGMFPVAIPTQKVHS